jgi:hypothetical protein
VTLGFFCPDVEVKLGALEFWEFDIGVAYRQHADLGNDRLGQTGATTGVQNNDWVPLGLLEGLVVGEVRDLLLGKPSVHLANLDNLHFSLVQPWLNNVVVGLGHNDDMAVGLFEQVELALL